MKTKAIFYHAGCPVCVDAERVLAMSLDPAKFEVEVIHLGEAKNRLKEAETAARLWRAVLIPTDRKAKRTLLGPFHLAGHRERR